MGELGRDGIASSQLVVGISVSAGDADAVGGVLRAQVDTSVGGILPLGELEVDAQLLGGIGDGVFIIGGAINLPYEKLLEITNSDDCDYFKCRYVAGQNLHNLISFFYNQLKEEKK